MVSAYYLMLLPDISLRPSSGLAPKGFLYYEDEEFWVVSVEPPKGLRNCGVGDFDNCPKSDYFRLRTVEIYVPHVRSAHAVLSLFTKHICAITHVLSYAHHVYIAVTFPAFTARHFTAMSRAQPYSSCVASICVPFLTRPVVYHTTGSNKNN